MAAGTIVEVFIAPAAAAPTVSVREARAVAGAGLEGDRYFAHSGTFSKRSTPDHQVTLIESEAIEAARRDCGVEIGPGQSRRNLVTRGVALNHLVGREFTAGGARLRGLRLCEPCGHLERLTKPGIKDALVHRGGLRAEIIAGGVIRPGDAIEMAEGS
jgi:MOSC domain-containing protein YiiM